jgi:hypothetical protein
MLDCNDLVSSLARRGVRLWAEQGRLHFNAPKGALLPQDLTQLREHKSAVIALLEEAELRRGVCALRRASSEPLPLTALQSRRWQYLRDTQNGLSERTCVVAQRVQGPLDLALLRASLEALAQRHDGLRLSFREEAGSLVQSVQASAEVPFEIVDLRSCTDAAGHVAAECRRLIMERVDVRVGPLFATKVFSVSEQEHVLIVVIDHMIADAGSCDVVAAELWELYCAHASPRTLREIPLQFPDHVSWQHRTRDAWYSQHANYWRCRLADLPRSALADFAIPAGRAVPMSGVCNFSFGGAVSAGLRSLARRERNLPALVVLTLFANAVTRWLNETDVLLAFVSNGRDKPELEPMVGFLADYLHLRIQTVEQEPFPRALERITTEFRTAYEHQDYGRAPDFLPQCVPHLAFNWLPAGQVREINGSEGARAIRVEAFPVQLAFPLPDPIKLAPLFRDAPGGIDGALYYRPDVFAADTIEQLSREIVSLAAHVAAVPDA